MDDVRMAGLVTQVRRTGAARLPIRVGIPRPAPTISAVMQLPWSRKTR